MSYISAYAQNGVIKVWEKDEDGSKRCIDYPTPYYFYVPDNGGEFTSIYKKPLRKEEFTDYNTFTKKREMYKQRGILLYESDIQPTLKVLTNNYYNKKAPKLNFTLYDIEVDYNPNDGFSSVENPYAPINAVALHHYWKNKSVVIAVPPPSYSSMRDEWDKEIDEIRNSPNLTLHLVKNERELLELFLTEIEDSDVLSGWNSDTFDMPYVTKRIEMVMGKPSSQRLCFPGAPVPQWRQFEVYGKLRDTVDLFGRMSIDYMLLFKKFEVSDRPSFSLEAISNEILPDLPKLEYEGTLFELYHKNFPHFLRYNYRDTEVLAGFERKLGYLEVANMLYHMSCGLAPHIFGTIRLADLAITLFCHNEKNVKVPDRDETKPDGTISGAMVLHPQMGMHDWLASVDVTSLYPSAIRTVNISPETLIGQMRGFLSEDDRMKHSAWLNIFEQSDNLVTLDYDFMCAEDGYNGSETHTGSEWFEILLERGWAISGYGTIYTQNFPGIIPAILTDWFNQRKKYKKLKDDAKQLSIKLKEEKASQDLIQEQIDLSEYYDRLQYIFKIKLNSLYGALTNFTFRFFDLRLGESTTGTGRCVLDHMCSTIAKTLDGVYSFKSESIIYGDTDSSYFKTHAKTIATKQGLPDDKIYDLAVQIGDKLGQVANESFPDFCIKAFRVKPEYSKMIKCEREVIGKRGIFVTKKRYVIKVVNLDGYKTNKLKAMGLEMKKTTTPKHIQKFTETVVNMILDGEASWDQIEDFIINFRAEMHASTSLFDIGLPKGVKGVEEYTKTYETNKKLDVKTRLPGHVAASIHYNECLQEFGDKESMSIVSGTKIKVFYLKRPRGRFKSIAIPTDLGKIPKWMLEHDEFSIDVHKHEDKLIDAILSKIFVVLNEEVPTAQSKFNNSLMEW